MKRYWIALSIFALLIGLGVGFLIPRQQGGVPPVCLEALAAGDEVMLVMAHYVEVSSDVLARFPNVSVPDLEALGAAAQLNIETLKETQYVELAKECRSFE